MIARVPASRCFGLLTLVAAAAAACQPDASPALTGSGNGSLSIAGGSTIAPEVLRSVTNADELLIVDCALPPIIRRLGSQLLIPTPRRPIRTTARECQIRGGEYTAYDRANYQTALGVWLDSAQQGDIQAQIYVGEIFERGLGRPPDYAMAASWYQRAAEKGDRQAAARLYNFHQLGLGVQRDPQKAREWLLQSLDVGPEEVASVPAPTLDDQIAVLDNQIRQLTQERDIARQEAARLNAQLLAEPSGPDRDITIAALQAELAELKTAKNAEITRLMTEIGALKVERDQLATSAGEQETQISRLERELASKVAELEQKGRWLDNQRRQLETLRLSGDDRRAIADLAEQNEKLLAKTTSQIEGLRLSLAETRNALATREAEFQNFTDSLDVEKGEHAAARSQVLNLESERGALQGQLTALERKQGVLRNQIADLQNVALTKEEQVLQQADRIQILETEIVVAEQSRIALRSDTDRLAADLERRQAELDSVRKELAQTMPAPPTIELLSPPLNIRGAGAKLGIARPRNHKSLAVRVDAPGDLNRFAVNDENLQLSETGQYSVTMPESRLPAEGHRLSMLAVDMFDQVASLNLTLFDEGDFQFAPSALIPDETRAEFGNYYALVIGNDAYEHWPVLSNAVRDAEAVAQVLKESYGFDVTLLTDATELDMLSAVATLGERTTERDNVLIFYAGHGHLVGQNRVGYWIPVDGSADPQVRDNWIRNDEITDHLQQMRAKQVLVIADSCYAGSLGQGGGGSPPTRSAFLDDAPAEGELARYLELAAGRTRLAITSGGVKPVLDGGADGHSVFTSTLLNALERNRSVIELNRMFDDVRARVQDAAREHNFRQIPTLEKLYHGGHVGGDFVFLPTSSSA